MIVNQGRNTNMNVNEGKMNFYIILGFNLGRLEFLWDSPFEAGRKAFEPSKQQLLQMLGDDIHPDETSYQSFCQSIMYHYMKNNVESYAFIMMGISLQRASLLKACLDDEGKREELTQLARSPIDSIPTSIVDDKDLLFSIIIKNRDKSISEVSALIHQAFFAMDGEDAMSHTNQKSRVPDGTEEKYLFISYSSKDRVIAEKLKGLLENSAIRCWMAPSSIPVGSDYTEVIVRAIEKSSGVVFLLSQNSQNSQWVPKELDIAISADKVIFPIHIDEEEIIKKIHFRITDSQIIEARGNVDSIFKELVNSIQAFWSK